MNERCSLNSENVEVQTRHLIFMLVDPPSRWLFNICFWHYFNFGFMITMWLYGNLKRKSHFSVITTFQLLWGRWHKWNLLSRIRFNHQLQKLCTKKLLKLLHAMNDVMKHPIFIWCTFPSNRISNNCFQILSTNNQHWVWTHANHMENSNNFRMAKL